MLISRVSVLLLLVLARLSNAMEPLTESDLGEVIGGEGVIFDISLLNNVDEDRNPINCDGLLNPCRFGLEFAEREGIWLMLKELYGSLVISDMRVDVGFLPETPTGFGDLSRFLGRDGDCLVENCDPRGGAALLITYPENKGVGEYEDMKTFFNIGRAALEYDQGGIPGYQQDAATGSFLGYRISDSSGPNAEAGVRFRGTGYVYGF